MAESSSKKECLKWEDIPKVSSNPEYKKYVPTNFAELSGGHRYCRNPINQKKYPEAMMDSPWCFVSQDDGSITAEACLIENVSPSTPFPTIQFISFSVRRMIRCRKRLWWFCFHRLPCRSFLASWPFLIGCVEGAIQRTLSKITRFKTAEQMTRQWWFGHILKSDWVLPVWIGWWPLPGQMSRIFIFIRICLESVPNGQLDRRIWAKHSEDAHSGVAGQ